MRFTSFIVCCTVTSLTCIDRFIELTIYINNNYYRFNQKHCHISVVSNDVVVKFLLQFFVNINILKGLWPLMDQ